MDAKERIIRTICHEEPDKVPSYEGSIDNLSVCEHYDLKYSLQGLGAAMKMAYNLCFRSKKLLNKLASKINSVKGGLEGLATLYSRAGIELVPTPLALYPQIYEKDGFIDEYGRINKFKKNPEDNMDILYYMGGHFHDFEDFEKFPQLDPDNPFREEAYRHSKVVEEQFKGKVYMAPMVFGMMEMTWEAFGMEDFSRMLARPNEIKRIFDNRGEFTVELVKRIIEWGETGPIIMCDDYGYKAGLFMSPKNYHKYVLPWIKKICDTAHKGGLKFMLHSCGDIYKIFEDLIKNGVDAIHPIEPTTSNPDFDIFKLHEKHGDKVTFVGNVSPQDLSTESPEFIREYTKKLLKEIAPGGGLILGSGHSINPAIKVENFLAMRETVDKYGKYPIKIE